MFGWREKILRVDSGRNELREESLVPAVAKRRKGGWGL